MKLSHLLLIQSMIFRTSTSDPPGVRHLKELAARAPQAAAAGLGLGEQQMFPQHLRSAKQMDIFIGMYCVYRYILYIYIYLYSCITRGCDISLIIPMDPNACLGSATGV